MTRIEASYILRKFYADGYKSNNYNTLEQALQLAVMCLENFPCWISVNEVLPPKKSKYDDLSINVLATDGKEIYESVYNHDSKDWFTHDMWGLDNIIYWMPMPAPPHHIIDANKKVDRVIGTADHIKTALDVLNKKGGEE